MRSHYCGQINESQLDQKVVLCGWVHRRRDHGGVIFIDLRDREGLVQVVYEPDQPDIFGIAEQVRSEYVLCIEGRVRSRPEGHENPNLDSGKVEILGMAVNILNTAETPPFPLDSELNVNEDTRLQYRYIDLRRPEMQHALRMRGQINRVLRDFLEHNGFCEIETPMLTKATPEGARDYLVPSRTHRGKFFALPQSPQIFKQLLMIAGFDRYYQIVRCFRDEDLRADRQPEFTQLDIETSFMDENAIMVLMEKMICKLFAKILDIELPTQFPRMTYQQAMQDFGSDRPDLRNPLRLIEVGDVMTGVQFKVFSGPANDENGRVAALCVPNGCRLTRKEIDNYTSFVAIYGARGLAYIKVNDVTTGREGLQSPILKFLADDVITTIIARTAAKTGDLIFFGADKTKVVNESLGALRQKLGADLELNKGDWELVWVVDFPMFEWDDKETRWSALHHPFTAPAVDNIEAMQKAPGECLSRAYDLVLNGSEIGGGSIRIHSRDLQMAVFQTLQIASEEANEKFGFLLDALKYGCPPHGGLAFGLDRLVALMAERLSIREVMAFPKTQTANCPLTSAPASVTQRQLSELGIQLKQNNTVP